MCIPQQNILQTILIQNKYNTKYISIAAPLQCQTSSVMSMESEHFITVSLFKILQSIFIVHIQVFTPYALEEKKTPTSIFAKQQIKENIK